MTLPRFYFLETHNLPLNSYYLVQLWDINVTHGEKNFQYFQQLKTKVQNGQQSGRLHENMSQTELFWRPLQQHGADVHVCSLLNSTPVSIAHRLIILKSQVIRVSKVNSKKSIWKHAKSECKEVKTGVMYTLKVWLNFIQSEARIIDIWVKQCSSQGGRRIKRV